MSFSAPVAACGLSGLLALLLLTACGAPRPLQLNPGRPEFPPPLFSGDLPRPEVIGLSAQRLELQRTMLAQVASSRPDREEYIEYFSNHPYLLAVHYHIDTADSRVVRLEYELIPRVHTDVGLRLALFGELVAALGTPRESGDAVLWSWQSYLLRWRGVRVDVVRRPDPVAAQ